MIKSFRVLMLAFIFSLVLAWPVLAQGPELLAVDAHYESHRASIESFQADYLEQHGHYYQMFWSHTYVPTAGEYALIDNIGSRPDDQDEKAIYLWQNTTLPITLDYRLRIDVHDGTGGAGYLLNLQTAVTSTQVFSRYTMTHRVIWDRIIDGPALSVEWRPVYTVTWLEWRRVVT